MGSNAGDQTEFCIRTSALPGRNHVIPVICERYSISVAKTPEANRKENSNNSERRPVIERRGAKRLWVPGVAGRSGLTTGSGYTGRHLETVVDRGSVAE